MHISPVNGIYTVHGVYVRLGENRFPAVFQKHSSRSEKSHDYVIFLIMIRKVTRRTLYYMEAGTAL